MDTLTLTLTVFVVFFVVDSYGLPKQKRPTTAVTDLNQAHLCPLGLPLKICDIEVEECPKNTFCHSNAFGDFCCPQTPSRRTSRLRFQDASSPWQRNLFGPDAHLGSPGNSPFETGQLQANPILPQPETQPDFMGTRSQVPNYGASPFTNPYGSSLAAAYAGYGPQNVAQPSPYAQGGLQGPRPSPAQAGLGVQQPFMGAQLPDRYGQGGYGRQPIFAQPISGGTQPRQPVFAQPVSSYGQQPIRVYGQPSAYAQPLGPSQSFPVGYPQQPGQPGIPGVPRVPSVTYGQQLPGSYPTAQSGYGRVPSGISPYPPTVSFGAPPSGYPSVQYPGRPATVRGTRVPSAGGRFNYLTAALQVAAPQPFAGVFAQPAPRGGSPGSPFMQNPQGATLAQYPPTSGGPQYQRGPTPPRLPYPAALQQTNVERSRSPAVQLMDEAGNNQEREAEDTTADPLASLNLDSAPGNTVMEALLQQVRKLHAVSYSRSDCVRCRTAEALLEGAYSIPLTVFHLDKLPKGGDLLEFLGSITGSNEVPQLFVCGYYIGGYDHLLSYHETGELETFVHKCFVTKNNQNISQ